MAYRVNLSAIIILSPRDEQHDRAVSVTVSAPANYVERRRDCLSTLHCVCLLFEGIVYVGINSEKKKQLAVNGNGYECLSVCLGRVRD